MSGPVHLETTRLINDRYVWLCDGCHKVILEKGGFIK